MSMTGSKDNRVAILVPEKIEFEPDAKFVSLHYALINTNPFFGRSYQISGIEATFGNQVSVFTPRFDSLAQQDVAISNLTAKERATLPGRSNNLEDPVVVSGMITREGHLPWSLGTKPTQMKVEPLTLWGLPKNVLSGDSQKTVRNLEAFFERKTSRHLGFARIRLRNTVVSGAREQATGAIVAPVIWFDAQEGTIELTVRFSDGSWASNSVKVEKAPQKCDIESLYVPGDGHIHTDYSWYCPTIHIPNGPTIEDRIYEGLDCGLKWMFMTDYSIQFFSKYSKGGVSHLGNADIDPNTGKPFRTIVWDDHVDECFKVLNAEDENFVVVASQEVPSNIDSHNLVWASKHHLGKEWDKPERIRSEQFDASFFSIYHLLKFLFGSYYIGKAFSHDEPWQDRDIRMNPYEGYDKPPHIYFEHDLVWANGFLKKPFVVAAHPYNSSYKYRGLHLSVTGRGWQPMAVSHALGSHLIGFEIFEETINPATEAKPEVLAVWNMFLWRELTATFENGKFLVAFANSDAHLTSFSGQKKFGKTKTFALFPDFSSIPKNQLFEKLIKTLESGHCTCSPKGDFGTFVLKRNGKTYHPGDFAEIVEGESIEFELYGRPSSQDRVFFGGRILSCVNPELQEHDSNAVTPTKDTDYLKTLKQMMDRYAVDSESPDGAVAKCVIAPENPAYPGKSLHKTSKPFIDDMTICCLRAELVFATKPEKSGTKPETASVVYTNPIFVKMIPKP
jgi:hypothetical protein